MVYFSEFRTSCEKYKIRALVAYKKRLGLAVKFGFTFTVGLIKELKIHNMDSMKIV